MKISFIIMAIINNLFGLHQAPPYQAPRVQTPTPTPPAIIKKIDTPKPPPTPKTTKEPIKPNPIAAMVEKISVTPSEKPTSLIPINIPINIQSIVVLKCSFFEPLSPQNKKTAFASGVIVNKD